MAVGMNELGCAWITGASSGLGRALAQRMAAEGWSVAASARSAESLDELARGATGLTGEIRAYPLDVTDPATVTATVAAIERNLGPIDQAVLNAGTHRPVRAAKLIAAAFRDLTELNLMGTVHCLEALLPAMIERRGGRIAVVASVAGYRGLPTSAAYVRNSATQDKFPRSVLPGTFDFGFTTGLSYKDVSLCIDEAEALGVPMVVGSTVRQMLAVTKAMYGADSDFTSMCRVIESWAGVEVRG